MTNIDLKNILIFTTIFHMVVFVIDSKLSANYAYLIDPPFTINYAFNPYFYVFIVIMVFNFVLGLEYLLINSKALSKLKILGTAINL